MSAANVAAAGIGREMAYPQNPVLNPVRPGKDSAEKIGFLIL
jgi:hypothetical protein